MICVVWGIQGSRIPEVSEMTGWLALAMACALSGALGFSAVRLGMATSRGTAGYVRRRPVPVMPSARSGTFPPPARPGTLPPPAAAPARAATPPPATTANAGTTRARHSRSVWERTIPPERTTRRPARRVPPQEPKPVPHQRAKPVPPQRPSAPKPTVAQPHERQLALWASQVAAGTRTMSLATDGCRVTWNRRCKHGHPSWLVHLEYLWPEDKDARS
jgi:hypothetical protein